jgi:2-succinyl-5-enolpyruvyl-6-hydroxy-3-cyclohexene-1-carboxylate synthase
VRVLLDERAAAFFALDGADDRRPVVLLRLGHGGDGVRPGVEASLARVPLWS